MKWLIVGISGPTCSGKTSIAKKVHESIPDSILINQDQYFLPQDDPRHTLIPELNHFNWEILSSLDMSKMYSDILKLIAHKTTDSKENGTSNNKKLLIIEGFLIYNYRPIQELCDQKYFVDISREVCWDRRKDRVYDPPDVPGYFDKIVWPEYIRHKSEMILDEDLHKSIKFLDGTKSLNELCDEVINEIKKLLC